METITPYVCRSCKDDIYLSDEELDRLIRACMQSLRLALFRYGNKVSTPQTIIDTNNQRKEST